MTVRNSPTDASEHESRSTRSRQLGLGRNDDVDPESSALATEDAAAAGSQETQDEHRSIGEVQAAAVSDGLPPKTKSFTSHWIVTVLGYALFAVVTVGSQTFCWDLPSSRD
jgi:hypothetical protein